MNTLSTLTTLAIDPSALGRLTHESLSQQSLMEMVVCHMSTENQRRFKDKTSDFRNLNEWADVVFNADGTVREVIWGVPEEYTVAPDRQGTISLEWFPDTIEEMWIVSRRFEGILECTKLPNSSETLSSRTTG